DSAISGSVKGMVGLESADQDARIHKHALDAIRIDALTTDGVIGRRELLGQLQQPLLHAHAAGLRLRLQGGFSLRR
ncbi:MAG: hypothetical protein JWO80_2681, partial [Bryobacterales bacterium]|nr:hypothetical protein [Bryobacterales bacterium]